MSNRAGRDSSAGQPELHPTAAGSHLSESRTLSDAPRWRSVDAGMHLGKLTPEIDRAITAVFASEEVARD